MYLGRISAFCAFTVVFAFSGQAVANDPAGSKYFVIHVIDEETGRGVPLVELRTVNNIRLVTDSAGIAAFYEPGLMNQTVYFSVRSHGYRIAPDRFGFQGVRLRTTPGTTATIKLKRINIAERLYRVTGQGIYRDSVLAGLPVPVQNPVINAGVLGCDSVTCAVYHGKIYWFWGDTNRASYPLGNFHTTGAMSLLPGKGGLDPAVGIDFDYFVSDDGFVRPMAPLNPKGPTWISGAVVLQDKEGREQLFAHYINVPPGAGNFRPVERGLARFNDETEQFEVVRRFPLVGPFPHGAHPVFHNTNGKQYIYYCDPYPLIRVEAAAEKLADPECYEAFTPLAPGTTGEELELDRRSDGTLNWAWKYNTEPLTPQQQQQLLRQGKIRPQEALLALRDVATGKPILAHRGSVHWNKYRGRWVMIFCELFGTSPLGEIWLAQGDSLMGPWVYAQKIVTHDQYSFYNPKHHPMFDEDGGRIIYFEATYTAAFSGNKDPTPRYDYNQIMYRVNLADPRLNLPVPVYEAVDNDGTVLPLTRKHLANATPRKVLFWALEQPTENTLAVVAEQCSDGSFQLRVLDNDIPTEGARILFYILKPDADFAREATVVVYKFRDNDGNWRLLAPKPNVPADLKLQVKPAGRVWPHPLDSTPWLGM